MASNYEQLIEALRCKGLSKECDSCGYGFRYCPDSECNDACHVERIIDDAAAAIEALETEIRESMQKCAECGDANMPKRGEWIVTTETSDDGTVSQHINCSVCGFYWREPKHRKVFKRCPNCGAKMEVQDDK